MSLAIHFAISDFGWDTRNKKNKWKRLQLRFKINLLVGVPLKSLRTRHFWERFFVIKSGRNKVDVGA